MVDERPGGLSPIVVARALIVNHARRCSSRGKCYGRPANIPRNGSECPGLPSTQDAVRYASAYGSAYASACASCRHGTPATRANAAQRVLTAFVKLPASRVRLSSVASPCLASRSFVLPSAFRDRSSSPRSASGAGAPPWRQLGLAPGQPPQDAGSYPHTHEIVAE